MEKSSFFVFFYYNIIKSWDSGCDDMLLELLDLLELNKINL